MDTITSIALSADNEVIRSIGWIIDNNFIFVSLIVIMILAGEGRNDKRLKLALSVVLALLIGIAAKNTIAQERPCAGESWCPDDYSFPSLHGTMAFALMVGFLNKRSYLLFLAFALFVAFTRMNIGVHDFGDIAGALPIALVSYYITDLFWSVKVEWNAA
jgi:membrane-associated phospholipid phosphatase